MTNVKPNGRYVVYGPLTGIVYAERTKRAEADRAALRYSGSVVRWEEYAPDDDGGPIVSEAARRARDEN